MASEDLDLTFILGAPDADFMRFIRDVRSRVADPARRAPFENHPDLRLLQPTRSGPPQRWLRVRIRVENKRGGPCEAGANEIILWIRADNMYVVGFERVRVARGETTGARFEFGQTQKKQEDKGKNKRAKKKDGDRQNKTPLIQGSQPLGFDESYTELNGGRLDMYPPMVGRKMLAQAIDGLGRYPEERRTSESATQIRIWLRTMVITFSESIRFHEVCRFVQDLLRQNTDRTLEVRLGRQIHCWGNLCSTVICCANDPRGDDAERYKEFKKEGVCKSTEQACEIVAILNHGPAQDKTKRPKREARGRAIDDVPEALTFIEIFSVDISRSCHLYGEITIDDGISKQELFKRLRSGHLRAGPGELAYLAGPSRAVWGHGEVVMHVDLMDAVGSPDMTPDREVGSGTLVLNTYDTPEVEYDKVLEYVFPGLSGAVSVRCAIITNAVVATVMVKHTGKGPKYVFGKLSATTTLFGPANNVTLFKRDWKDAIFVQPGEVITLQRNVAVVLLDSALKIGADLWARATIPDMAPDVQILKYDGVVDAVTSGTEKTMSSDEVTVWVTWSVN